MEFLSKYGFKKKEAPILDRVEVRAYYEKRVERTSSFCFIMECVSKKKGVYFGWNIGGVLISLENILVNKNDSDEVVYKAVEHSLLYWLNKSEYDYERLSKKRLSTNSFLTTISDMFFKSKTLNTKDLLKIKENIDSSSLSVFKAGKNSALHMLVNACKSIEIAKTEALFRHINGMYIRDSTYRFRNETEEEKEYRLSFEAYYNEEPLKGGVKSYKIPILKFPIKEHSVGDVVKLSNTECVIVKSDTENVYLETMFEAADANTLRGSIDRTVAKMNERDVLIAVKITVEKELGSLYGYIPHYIIEDFNSYLKVKLRTGEFLMMDSKSVFQKANRLLWT